MKKVALLLVITFAVISTTSFAADTNKVIIGQGQDQKDPFKLSDLESRQDIQYYGNGVYHFSVTGFGSRLSAFLAAHPTLEVTAMAGQVERENRSPISAVNFDSDYGITKSYFVTFREKGKK